MHALASTDHDVPLRFGLVVEDKPTEFSCIQDQYQLDKICVIE